MVVAIAVLVSIGSILLGLFLILRPALAIEMQRRFYEKINWRIEPISMSKEIRNTRIMGVLLVIVLLAAITQTLISIR